MLTNGGEARVLGENSPLALALPKALGIAIVSESETRSDCINKSSLVVMISATCNCVMKTQVAAVPYYRNPGCPARGNLGAPRLPRPTMHAIYGAGWYRVWRSAGEV